MPHNQDAYISRTVDGVCPACGATALAVAPDRRVVCLAEECPRPTAVHELLGSDLLPTQHRLTITRDHWTAEHPLIERLDGDIHRCDVQRYASILNGFALGTYLITDDGHSFDARLVEAIR